MDLARFLSDASELPLQLPEGLPIRARVVRAREPLIRAGEASDHAYVVYRGLFEARPEGPEGHRLSWMSRGAWIGELGVLMGSPRTASVYAWRDSVVLEFGADETRALLTGDARSLAALTRHLMKRGERSVDPRPRPFVLGIIAADGDAALVREAVARVPNAALVDGEGWGDDDIAAIERVEARGADAHVLFMLAAPEDDAWTRMVVRAVDRVVVIAIDPPGDGAPGAGDRLAQIEGAFGLPEGARGYDVLAHPAHRLTVDGAGEREGVGQRARQTLTLRPGSVDDLADYLHLVVVEHATPGDLRRFELFRGLDDSALTQAQEGIEWRMVARGEPLIRAGEASDGLYLIQFGRLQASVTSASGERVTLSESGAYEVVGDTGLILESPRTADVHAKRDSRVGFLSAASFQRLQAGIPELGRNAARIASRRTLVPSDALTKPAPANIMFLSLDPCERSAAPARALEGFLRDELGRSAMLLTRAVVERHLGPGAVDRGPSEPGYRQLLAWLHRVSMDHEVVIYASDAADPGWARCCVRQADRLVLVAAAERNPGLRRLERELAVGDTPVDLLLMQPAGITRAAGTRLWLRERDCEFVHHVREGAPGDLAAAARRIMTRANGIAFAGAVTRAAAHCGVARAFESLSIPLDIVSGTSSGSVIAGGLAAGIDTRELREIIADLTLRARIRVHELHPPITALTSGKKMDEVYQGIFGDVDLEDLLIPCRLSSLDLLTHELLYLDRGPLWRAARASCSLPVLYPPVTVDGRVLVDGGIVSYIPVNAILPSCHHGLAVMSDIGDPTPWEVLREAEPYGTQMSGWSHLVDRLVPWRTPKPRPKIEDILFLSMITSNSIAEDRLEVATKHPAVCHVYQPLPGYGLFDVTPPVARDFEERTYRRACADLTAWLERRSSASGES